MADDLVDTRQIAARTGLALRTVRDHARYPAFPMPEARETGPGRSKLYPWPGVRAFYEARDTLKPEPKEH